MSLNHWHSLVGYCKGLCFSMKLFTNVLKEKSNKHILFTEPQNNLCHCFCFPCHLFAKSAKHPHHPNPKIRFIMLTDILWNKQVAFANNHLNCHPGPFVGEIRQANMLNYSLKTALLFAAWQYWANAHHQHPLTEPSGGWGIGATACPRPVDACLHFT